MEPRYKLKTAATLFPVLLADVKRNLRIATSDIDTDRDTLIQDLIYDAIIASQNATGRQYCPAVYTLKLDAYNDEIEITLGPVALINSVKYYAQGETELTPVDEDDYQLDNEELTARLRFLKPFSPDIDRMNVIEIEFINGFVAIGNQGPLLPVDLKQAVILRACDSYLHPENVILGKEPRAAELKERNYKVQRY
jgi:uncharacterized phiE125 gp8 family phage protein